jgi:glycosyltransferase involved in cell wall biosynthesis
MLTHDFPPEPIGGEGVYAGVIAKLLAERGVELEVLTLEAPGACAFDRESPFQTTRLRVPRWNFVARTLGFMSMSRRHIKRFTGDVVYSLRPVTGVSRPLVSHFHTTRRGEARAAWACGNVLAALANAVCIPLDYALAGASRLVIGVNPAMSADVGLDPHAPPHFEVVPNGVDTRVFSPAPGVTRRGERVLYIGRLDPRKRVVDLLYATAMLREDVPGISLSIVGGGSEAASLTGLAQTLGIADRVEFHPPVAHAETPGFYRSHGVLVLPSIYEPFGMVMLEAMSCGTPVLSSNACASLGQPTFQAGDYHDLASKLAILLKSAGERGRLANAGLDRAAECTWDKIADRVLSLLESSARRGEIEGDTR